MAITDSLDAATQALTALVAQLRLGNVRSIQAQDTGAADQVTLAPTPSVAAYGPDLIVFADIANPNQTLTPRLNVSGLGWLPIVTATGQPVAIGSVAGKSVFGFASASTGGYVAKLLFSGAAANPNNTQITPANQIGLSVQNDQAIPLGALVTAALQPIYVPANLATVANGIVTIVQPGEWLSETGIGAFVSSPSGPDRATLRGGLILNRNGSVSGTPFSSYPTIPAGGGQAVGNWSPSRTLRLLAGDQISLGQLVTTDSGNGVSGGIAGYTNLTMSLLNP